ncbi:YkvA family protein [Marinitoga litoralis]|uniref:YkvA family protein n=1 Tax=Marinitoga litoralis TaxID=570855 RepID=UPI001961330B|nr:DUF1232 domain-containing protein [Marinitoga litoralis]MBM7560031.1 uncharacterized membrane protein YkvA (DUF1232 family) [Marinitoga litoralis]
MDYENKIENKNDFYLKLRNSISNWLNKNRKSNISEFILLAPDLFYFFWKILNEKNLHIDYKIKIGLYLSYFISPIDIIPEGIIGPTGFIDDVYIGLKLLNEILNNVPYEIIEKHWPGDINILNNISEIIMKINNVIDSKKIKLIKNFLIKLKI